LRAIQDYRVINLWEVDVEIAFQQLPSLLPFTPILKGGNKEPAIQQALQMLRADEQLSQLETVLAFFATFVIDADIVQQIMRWDMEVLRESPWYQQILTEGEQRGRQEGRLEDRLSSIEMALEVKFSTEGLRLMSEIEEISDLEQLKVIQRGIMTLSTLNEVRELLQSLKSSSN
jgi:predicted transposase YdaD